MPHAPPPSVAVLSLCVIIALLVAILLPALGAARESARRAVCESNLKQFAIAVTMYRDDQNGEFPSPHNYNYPQDAPKDPLAAPPWLSLGVTLWPDSAEHIPALTKGLSAEDKHKVLAGNAARIYGFED